MVERRLGQVRVWSSTMCTSGYSSQGRCDADAVLANFTHGRRCRLCPSWLIERVRSSLSVAFICYVLPCGQAGAMCEIRVSCVVEGLDGRAQVRGRLES